MTQLRILMHGTLAEMTDECNARCLPRTDIVAERAVEIHRFEATGGPFSVYERRLELRPIVGVDHTICADTKTDTHANGVPLCSSVTLSTDTVEPDTAADTNISHDTTDTWELTETTTYHLAVPVWAWLFHWPVRRALQRRQDTHDYWWAPPERLDARHATVLGVLCTAQILDGYLGTVLTQTLAFAAAEFGHGNTAQGTVFAVVRVGVLLALVMLALADRHGRRRVITATGIASCVATAVGALSPSLWFLGGSQLVARGLSTALGVLIIIVAAEEMPARCRAWAASLLVLCAGLGSGVAVWVLPVVDLDPQAWRILYVVPLAGVAVFIWVGCQLPESRRFESATAFSPDNSTETRTNDTHTTTNDTHTTTLNRDHHTNSTHRRRRQRLILIASAAFLVALFAAPESGLKNDFLKDERGFSATTISLFTIVTSTPAGVGVLVGGYIADRWGRRKIGAAGLILGVSAKALSFFATGPTLWLLTLAGTVFSGLAVPALAVYGPELFGTITRGRINGIIAIIAVVGSAVGLLTTGYLSDVFGGQLGPAITLMASGPLAVAVLVITKFPETAGQELEDLNPEDKF